MTATANFSGQRKSRKAEMTEPLWVRLLADDPPELIEVPTLSDRAQLWCGRLRRDGRRELWELSQVGGTSTATSYFQDRASNRWLREQRSAVGLDLIEAVRQLTDLLQLSPDVTTRFIIGQDGPSVELIVEALGVSEGVTARAEWPDSVDVPWDEDLDIDAFHPDIEWYHVWAMIDEVRVSALRTTVDGKPVVIPVLLDLDPSDAPDWHPVEVVSESTWFNEGGGAPVSWSGINSILRLNGRVAVDAQRGDDGWEDNLIILSGP